MGKLADHVLCALCARRGKPMPRLLTSPAGGVQVEPERPFRICRKRSPRFRLRRPPREESNFFPAELLCTDMWPGVL